MKKDTEIKVFNRDNGAVVYSIPEMNGLRRVFQPGEEKEITFEEIQKLSYMPGGMALLEDSLVIKNPEAVSAILGHVEPEYSYDRNDIKKLMKEGSLDEFLDCLDFAPEGVHELIKALAVEMPLNDVAKRKAILEKLKFDVDMAVRIKEESEQPNDTQSSPANHRRVQKEQPQPTTTRRVVTKKG